jgi:hypothetical protein
MKSNISEQAVGTITLNAANAGISADGTWLQITDSVPKAATLVEIFNSTGSSIAISQGAVGSENANVLPYTILPGGSSFLVPLNIQSGKPFSVAAIDQASSTGVLILNLLG